MSNRSNLSYLGILIWNTCNGLLSFPKPTGSTWLVDLPPFAYKQWTKWREITTPMDPIKKHILQVYRDMFTISTRWVGNGNMVGTVGTCTSPMNSRGGWHALSHARNIMLRIQGRRDERDFSKHIGTWPQTWMLRLEGPFPRHPGEYLLRFGVFSMFLVSKYQTSGGVWMSRVSICFPIPWLEESRSFRNLD